MDVTATTVFVVLFVLITWLGFVAARWRRADLNLLHEWGLGGRRFGTMVTWFLLGGDLYTAYTFIAVPALIYGKGAMGFFAVPYTILIYPILYAVFPRLWRVAHAKGHVTAADFVRDRFDSHMLALAIAATGIVATMPYIALQLVGMEVVIGALGFPMEGFTGHLPLIIAFLILAAFTYRSGLRAPALIAVVKDLLIFITVIGAVIEDRRPGNPIGRINLATGLTLVLCVAFRLIAQQFDRAPGPLPEPAAVLAVLSSVAFAIALIGGSLALVAWYPDGRLEGGVGRLLKGLIVLGLAGSVIQLFRPGPIEFGWVEAVPNPLGIEALRWLFDAGAASLLLTFAVGLSVGLARQVWRYRRASAQVRAQLRWFLAAVSVTVVLGVLLFTTSGPAN